MHLLGRHDDARLFKRFSVDVCIFASWLIFIGDPPPSEIAKSWSQENTAPFENPKGVRMPQGIYPVFIFYNLTVDKLGSKKNINNKSLKIVQIHKENAKER